VLDNYVNATPSRVRAVVDWGIGGLTRGLHETAGFLEQFFGKTDMGRG